MGLWTLCGSYCMGYLTDGFVPEWYVKSWPKGVALAKRLVEARLWIPTTNEEGESGWQFHEFTGVGRNDSRAQIEESRNKWRHKKGRQRGNSPSASPGASPGDADGDTPPMSPGDSLRVTRDPTQPNVKETFGHLPESATETFGRDAIAATPGAELVRQLIPNEHPAAVRTALRIRASELIKQGTPRPDVAAALQLWLTKPSLGPNALPSLVSEAVKSRAAPVNGHDAKVNDFLAFAQPRRPEIQR